jgi:hypothetical protein
MVPKGSWKEKMLPIIRRVRQPLLPPEPLQLSVTELPKSEIPALMASKSLKQNVEPVPANVAPQPQGEILGSGVPPVSPASAPQTEIRSDSGQFRSDSVGRKSQPSAPHPETPWSRQTGESAADYQLFAAWLQLSAPRRFTKAAAALGSSVHRLRRLSALYRWKNRAAAFDEHRASACNVVLDEFILKETQDFRSRAECFRLQEWLLHEKILQAASDVLHELQKHPNRASLQDLVKLIDLAFVLGRRACGAPLDPAEQATLEPPSGYPDSKARLLKIYGPKIPSEQGSDAGSKSSTT